MSVQIVWSYDTTGSMSSCLNQVRGKIRELSARLLSDIPGLEIGLIAHGDYCDRATSYLVKTMSFSSSPEAIEKWVLGTGSTGGGDAPEAYEQALRAGFESFKWKPGARKVLAMIGDEEPHTPEHHENTDHTDWKVELDRLAMSGIRCFGVQCNAAPHAVYFYKALAEKTDGLWLPMNDLSIMADVFFAVCLRASEKYEAFDQFRSQLAEAGPVATALVPLMTRLAKKKRLSSVELASLCGVVAKLADEHGKPPKETFLPVEAVEISVDVGEGVNEVQLVQSFVNRGGVAGAGKSFAYRFALPQGAAVFYFHARLSSGKEVLGKVKGRAEAKLEYSRAIARGQTAFLVEENDADMFTMELGNLAEDEEVQITLRYVAEQEVVDGTRLQLRLPRHVAPRSGGQATVGALACYPITVNVRVAAGLCASGLRTTSHSSAHFHVAEQQETGGGLAGSLKLLPEDGLLNDDFVFSAELGGKMGATWTAMEYCKELDTTVVRVSLHVDTQHTDKAECHNVAVIVDASASMQGEPFADAVGSAGEFLAALQGQDVQCSCIIMRHKAEVLCDSVAAAAAGKLVKGYNQPCGGGSDFIAALDTLSSLKGQPDAVVFFSDGQGPQDTCDTFIKARDLGRRVFCLGVGPDPGAELLRGLAAVSSGAAELPARPELAAAAGRLARDVLASPVAMEVSSEHAVERWPERVTSGGRCTVGYLRLKGSLGELPVLSADGVAIELSAGDCAEGWRLHRLAARARITELERVNKGTHDADIRSLALEQGLASSQTSFVAVVDDTELTSCDTTNKPAADDVPTSSSGPSGFHATIGCDFDLAGGGHERFRTITSARRTMCVGSAPRCVLRSAPATKSSGCCSGGGGGSRAAAPAALVGSPAPATRSEYDYLFKFILVGESGTGKTSLLCQFCDGTFPTEHLTTIGVDFKLRVLELDGKHVKLQLWDTAGQERFRTITFSYFRGVHGALVVYDIGSRESFNRVSHWIKEVRNVTPSVQILVLGNKRDVVEEDAEKREVSADEGQELADAHGAAAFAEVSAAAGGDAVQRAFKQLAAAVLADRGG